MRDLTADFEITCPCGAKLKLSGDNLVHAFHATARTTETFQAQHAECIKAAQAKLRGEAR